MKSPWVGDKDSVGVVTLSLSEISAGRCQTS
jgi:hypothetical protein